MIGSIWLIFHFPDDKNEILGFFNSSGKYEQVKIKKYHEIEIYHLIQK